MLQNKLKKNVQDMHKVENTLLPYINIISTSHTLNPDQRAMMASLTEEIADDVFIDEIVRQKNIETIDKYMEEIKDLDEILDKIKETAVTQTEKQAT